MKRKLIKRNKCWLSEKVKSRTVKPRHEITFSLIAALKRKGQLAYEQRLLKRSSCNPRQSKKYRKACELREQSAFSSHKISKLTRAKARFK